ncbi:MAG: TIGR03013 family PEP-CTERM/XrtA system glycosyltransferase [Acidobacteriia bacterium]|nr:TIGR03013 family PEP-CTERM/XrtA system glycosyltransferase [Terriglobia bacterium]
MIRLFSVYYPTRTLVLVGTEALILAASLLLAVVICCGSDAYLILNYENGVAKVLAVSGLALLGFYYFDLYDLQRDRNELYIRLLFALGGLSLLLAMVTYLFPAFLIGNNVFTIGLLLATAGLLSWRRFFEWLLQKSFLRERVYVLGSGERAQRLVETLRTRPELGMEVIGWAGALQNGSLNRETLGHRLTELARYARVDRVIVALEDRRSIMPVRELLELRLQGVKIDDATALLEKVSGKIEVDQLYPSWLIFSEGFRLNSTFLLVRRLVSILISLALLILVLPLIPLIALAIRFTSPGPVFYRQRRVGQFGRVFYCYKFRTMRADAEADVGPTWAGDNDPRITPVGRFLRKTRLDELPQLWNVLRGDMGFVGPRPERPEFVEKLTAHIPYYHLRHIIRPGITGWAQINYHYGASIEESKEKLRYDLYYIKNISLSLDLYIVLQTIKTVVLGRGSR